MYEKTVSDISKSLRAMAKRVRRAEAQISRRRGIPYGTTADREANEQSQLWWDIDLDALMANFGDGWEPVKDVRTGTTAQRTAYTGTNAGEFWWDTDEERLYAWDGHVWESTDSAESGTTVERNASSPVNGQWWLDTDDGLTHVYDGIEWKTPVSSRYIEPFLLLAGLYGLFAFIPYAKDPVWPILVRSVELSNLVDYPGDVWHTENYEGFPMLPHNSPEHGDNGQVPYIDLESSSSQYCTTKNYRTTGDLTVLAWVSPDTDSNTMPIVDKWYEDSNDRCYKLTLESNNTFRFHVSTKGFSSDRSIPTSVLTSGELRGWNFVVARLDAGNEIGIYHNGAWETSTIAIPPSIHDYDDDIVFGKSNAASPVYFDGQMSIVAICKYAIPDELIDYIYENTKHSYIPQPEPQPSDDVSVGEYAYIQIEEIDWILRPRKKEYISVSESISMFGLTNPDVSETISVTENIGVYRPELDALEVSVSDSTSISEDVESLYSIGANVSDSISVSEYVDASAPVVLGITVDDSVGVTDSVVVDGVPNIATDESVAVTESINVYYPILGTIAVIVSDSTSVTESVSVEDIPNITANESVSVSENVDTYYPELGARSVNVSDSMLVTESVDIDDIPNATVSDSIAVSESVDAYYPALETIDPSASDNVSITENVYLDGVPNIATADSIAVSEYDNVNITGALPSAINKVNYLLTDNKYFYANYWARTYPYWTTAWTEPGYLLTNNGYFNANYWPRRYKYWAIAP